MIKDGNQIKKRIKIFLLLLFFLGIILGGDQFFGLKKVSATEIIKKSLEKIIKKGTIYHHKVNYYQLAEEKNQNKDPSLVSEIWEDQDSSRFKNQVIYNNGQKIIQVFDGDIYWDYNEAEKTLKKDIYIYPDPKEKEVKRGERVDLIKTYRELLDNGRLIAEEKEIEGRKVWQVIDKKADENSFFWDIFYFDKETFLLLQQEKLQEKNGKKILKEKMIYEIMEAIPKENVDVSKIFLFDYPLSEGTKVFERHFNITTGYLENDYYLATASSILTPTPNSPLSLTPTNLREKINNWKTFTDPTNSYSFKYPDKWQLMTTVFYDENKQKIGEISPGLIIPKETIGCEDYFFRVINGGPTIEISSLDKKNFFIYTLNYG